MVFVLHVLHKDFENVRNQVPWKECVTAGVGTAVTELKKRTKQ